MLTNPGPKTLFLDTETFCELSLNTHGAYRYAEEAEVMLTAVAWGEGPVDVIEGIPGNLQEMIDYADEIVIQNSFFDRSVLKFNSVNIPVEKITDTMVLSLAHGYPGSLDMMCDALKIPVDMAKKKTGKKLINLFCKPRPKKQKLRRATKHTHPKEWAEFVEYAGFDIISMREAYRRLPRWNVQRFERELWYLDQKINDRGIYIDLELARAALRAADRAKAELADEAADLTDGAIGSTTQRDRFKEYLNDDLDYRLPDLKKGTIKAVLKRGGLPDDVRELLENRQQASLTSPAKYTTLIRATSPHDGRLRGTLQFCGAGRTSRWGGRLFQPQNLPRPLFKWAMVELGLAAIKSGNEDLIFEKVMEICASAIRSAMIAAPGRKLSISDLRNIEGRVSAWLAGEEWKIKAFADYDKKIGFDIYILAYARAFGIPPELVLKNKEEGDGMWRQIGKVMELALGYGGAVGAFASMGLLYGVELPEDEVVTIVQKWRRAHPCIKNYWYDLEWAIRQAFRNPGESFKARLITADRVGHTVRLRMPSGSYLSYPHFDEDESGQCTYEGVNQYTRRWERISSYGPKFFENCVQKIARDILAIGLMKSEKEGFNPVLHVHDEVVAEPPEDSPLSHERLSQILATNPSWTVGLPLAAAGFDAKIYRKED